MAAEPLRVNRTVSIPVEELEVRFSPSGGPGGQHANRSNTRVELRFDVESSSALGRGQKEVIIARLGPVVRVVVDSERSQARNRAIAAQRLATRLASALRVPAARIATRPSRAAHGRRLNAKRHRSTIKRQRGRPSMDE